MNGAITVAVPRASIGNPTIPITNPNGTPAVSKPFAYTIATFSLYRPFEMVRDDLCYQNLPVTVVGMGSGVIYSTLGGTHHTQEDIAIAGALPNMQIIAPCDPAECTEATTHCATQKKGPVYLRIGKAGEPNLTEKAVDPWVFGKLRYLTRGSDVCILSYGVIMTTLDGSTAGSALAWEVSARVATLVTLMSGGVLSTYRDQIKQTRDAAHGWRGGSPRPVAAR